MRWYVVGMMNGLLAMGLLWNCAGGHGQGGDGAPSTKEGLSTPDTIREAGKGGKEGGGDFSSLQQYLSGSRIRAKYIEGEDGSKAFLGWYDKKLGKDCSWTSLNALSQGVSESKTQFCLPSGEVSFAQANYFSDEKCTIPVFSKTPCANRRIILIASPNPNPPQCSELKDRFIQGTCRVVGEAMSPQPEKIYKIADGKCMEGQVPPGTSIHEVPDKKCTDEVLSQYAKGEIKTE